MKKLVALLGFLILTGCQAGSHIELGPIRASSWISAHQFYPTTIWVRDGRIGSSCGFFSSEISFGADMNESDGLSVGARLLLDKDDPRWVYPE